MKIEVKNTNGKLIFQNKQSIERFVYITLKDGKTDVAREIIIPNLEPHYIGTKSHYEPEDVNLASLIYCATNEPKRTPTEITARKGCKGWENLSNSFFENIKDIVYLGKCFHDGDMFAVYKDNGFIHFAKGYLNDGFIEI